MKIGIIPSIKEPYKNQFEYCVDIKLMKFLKSAFKYSEIEILINIKKKNLNLLCMSGGNDILKFNRDKRNLIRYKLDKYYYNFCKKKKIPILGICHGAHFISSQEGSEIGKKKHVGSHTIKFNKKKLRLKQRYVNSFHNFVIKKLGNSLEALAYASDGTIECFTCKENKILGIMWHPERDKKINQSDVKLIKNYYDINSFGGR